MISSARARLALALISTPLLLLCGCGGSDLVSVSGTVTLDGAPLADAVVMFNPEGAGGASATGVTDSSGNFKMGTRGTGDGVRPGKYKITVTNSYDPHAEGPGHPSEAFGAGKMKTQSDYQKMQAQARKDALAKAKKAPPIYTDVQKTPFTIEVPAQRDIKLELKSDQK